MKRILFSTVAVSTLFLLSFSVFTTASNAEIPNNNSHSNITNIHIDAVQNYGIVKNAVGTISNSGGNTTISNGGNTTNTVVGGNANNTVNTGNAGSDSTVINCVNTTVIGNGNNPCIQATPTPAPVPTATPTPGSHGGGTDGGSSSSSSGGSSSSGSNSPAVLGTMASTGTFTDTMMNTFGALGVVLLTTSLYLSRKRKSVELAFH